MDELNATVRDALAFLRNALPWAAGGISGGALRLLDPEEKTTFKLAWWLMMRSIIVGVLVGLLIDDYSLRDGSKVVIVAFVSFGADTIVKMLKAVWAQVRQNPWIAFEWIARRKIVPPSDITLPPAKPEQTPDIAEEGSTK